MGGESLVESLEVAARAGDAAGLTLHDARGRAAGRRSWADVDAAARRAAAGWRALGVRRGDRVLVALPTGWDWLDAWLGALRLGALPAAAAPPGAVGARAGSLRRLAALRDVVDARRIAAPPAARDALREEGRDDVAARVATPEELEAASSSAAPVADLPRPRPEEIAFLQFTSGSTGTARAVRIPHAAVLHNNRVSADAIGAPWGRPAETWARGMAAWLPLHHDMGLVGCLFLSIALRRDLALLPPQAFLARPLCWLERLAEAGTTFAPAPNFGYQLCVERLAPDELAGLDLSGWRAALTGAEMVRPETCADFAALAAGAGFRPEAFVPCYGLAEATLAVTYDLDGRGVRTRRGAVAVGRPVADTELKIAAPDGRALPDGATGEILVRGPGVFDGYWEDPAATAEALVGGFLRTGDLGFVEDGELHVTGRIKDVLILRGHNLMPHELEWHAEAVAAGGGSLRAGAFSVEDGARGEQAVLAMETLERDPTRLGEMEREIRNRVGRDLGLVPADVVFVRRGRIPKTTSGKVRRAELRAAYLAGTLERIEGGRTADETR